MVVLFVTYWGSSSIELFVVEEGARSRALYNRMSSFVFTLVSCSCRCLLIVCNSLICPLISETEAISHYVLLRSAGVATGDKGGDM